MKTKQVIYVVLFIILASWAIIDTGSDVKEAYEYYKTNHIPWLAIVISSFVIGFATLIYRDKTNKRSKLIHSFILLATLAVLCTGSTIWAICHVVTLWQDQDMLVNVTANQPYKILLLPILLLLISVWLWFEAISTKCKHRTFASIGASKDCVFSGP